MLATGAEGCHGVVVTEGLFLIDTFHPLRLLRRHLPLGTRGGFKTGGTMADPTVGAYDVLGKNIPHIL